MFKFLNLLSLSQAASIPPLDPSNVCEDLPEDTLPPLVRVNSAKDWKGNLYEDYMEFVEEIP